MRRPEKLTEPLTLFVDRSLGTGAVHDALVQVPKANVAEVLIHDDLFPQDADDEVWLTACGDKKWVAITKDRLKENPTEREAIKNSGAVVFRVSAAGRKGSELAALVASAMPLVLRVIRRYRPPILATITASGAVRVLLGDGEDFKPPRDVKP